MISYKPFYETLFKKDITEYYLIFKQGFSANTLHKMKKGEAISTKTLDALVMFWIAKLKILLNLKKNSI